MLWQAWGLGFALLALLGFVAGPRAGLVWVLVWWWLLGGVLAVVGADVRRTLAAARSRRR